MTPYAVQTQHIRHEDVLIFKKMQRIVEQLPDSTIPGLISCHHICHGLAGTLGVEAVDGSFGPFHDHSWVSLGINDHGEVIADMYPVAGATPFLVLTVRSSPWATLYMKDERIGTRVRSRPGFGRELAEITRVMRRLNAA